MDQKRTPLYDALMRHKEQKPVSFHVPGHKNGQIFNEKARLVFESILTIDMTEISGLDDLHAPDGPILEAEQLLAELYQVKSSYFLVNGSTVGNLAMILATCEKSDVVLVQRNCHKSVLHGLMLAEVEPVFIAPKIDEEWGLAGGVRLKDLQEALQAYPQTKAIILTHPTYHGQSNELTEIVSIAHKKNIPVLVDEAHGAHFILGSPFPESAIKAGADVVVHSAHKTLPAMTMGSYLHVNSELINENRVAFYLQMLQSSSPSYPIMASLDLARAYLASFSAENKEILLKKISSFRDELKQIKDIDVMEGTNDRLDPLKITIRSKRGLSGYELQQRLEKQGIYPELADPNHVLLVLPLLKNKNEFFAESAKLIGKAAAETKNITKPSRSINRSATPVLSKLELSYSEMKQKRTCFVPFVESVNKRSAEMIIPYPPGVPLIMAGEKITKAQLDKLNNFITAGARFHGGVKLQSQQLMVFE